MGIRTILAVTLSCICITGSIHAGTYITPGTGWTGITPEPATIGSSGDRGYDCKAIARWDVVPHQTFADTFNVGIVAFHLNGIDRVEIAANGGAWTTVTSMTYNERTGVTEYWATLRASDFADGEVDLRAVIYPKSAGIPRTLQDTTGYGLVLYANAGGTLPAAQVYVSPAAGSDTTGDGTESRPFQTFLKALEYLGTPDNGDGATIYLGEGTYQYPNSSKGTAWNRWLTLTPWPGVGRSSVVFSGSGAGVLQRWLHIKNITIDHSVEDAAPFKLRSGPYNNRFWADSCDMAGNGYAGDSLSSGGFINGNQWITDCRSHDHKTTISGSIIRNLEAWYLSGDFVNSRGLNINCHLRHMRPAPGVHPDIVQHYTGKTENYIMYGLKALDVMAQGINITQLDTVRDIALVNCHIEHYATALRNFMPTSYSSTSHVLLWHSTFINVSTVDNHGGQTDLDIRGCVFSNLNYDTNADYSGWTMTHNHFYNANDARGADSTSGDPFWTTIAAWDSSGNQTTAGDYLPRSGSPLPGRMNDVLVPVDIDGNLRQSPTAVGAYAGAEEAPVTTPFIAAADAPAFSIHPNPVAAGGTLHLDGIPGNGLFLYDADGTAVRKLGAVTELDGIGAGLYFVGDGISAVKILVR